MAAAHEPEKVPDKDEGRVRLEQEMIKRRERIERWRAERKQKEQELQTRDNHNKPTAAATAGSAKKWSLEEDDESEEDDDQEVQVVVAEATEATPAAPSEVVVVTAEEDEVDPLDAFMAEVNAEVRKVNKLAKPTFKTESGGVVVVTGVAKNAHEAPDPKKKRGEVIEQNQDGLEYSSEEEVEDIKDTAANLANKHKKELAKIDHSGITYAPFRRSFYVEVPELTKMTPEEVEVYRQSLDSIQVTCHFNFPNFQSQQSL